MLTSVHGCVCVCTTSTTAPGLPYWDRDREDKHYGDNELTLMTNKLDDNTTQAHGMIGMKVVAHSLDLPLIRLCLILFYDSIPFMQMDSPQKNC